MDTSHVCEQMHVAATGGENLVVESYRDYNESEILPLYQAVGWTNYTQNPEMLRSAYSHSLETLVVRDGGKTVGLIRAVGDGHSIVYIQDIIVHPEYQRRGIGTRLIQAMLAQFQHVYQIVLSTDSEARTIAFYESVGFTEHSKLGCAAFFKIRTS